MKLNGYHKKEKLKSRTQLEAIFATGKSFSVFPLKIFFLETDASETACIKAGVGVSARHFKKAVDRNRIKRLLREAYRLEKHTLLHQLEKHEKKIALFLLYIDKEMPDYVVLREKMKEGFEKLQSRLSIQE